MFPYQLLRAEGHFPWFTSVCVSKLPGVWQICSAAAFWEIYALRDRQQSTTPNQLWRTQDVPTHVKAWNDLKLSLLQYHATISAQSGFCALLSTMSACTKEPGSLCMPSCPQLPQEISTLFLKPWWPVCLLPLKILFFPSLRGEATFTAWVLLLHPHLNNWIKAHLAWIWAGKNSLTKPGYLQFSYSGALYLIRYQPNTWL